MSWVAWDKLYVSKKEGGLGFRNLFYFNKALLVKQGWRILNNEDSLMARVLKGKYFPSSSFLEAKVTSNMSYTWRSILNARDVIMKGARKILGDGSTTNVWKGPWVPTLSNFKVDPAVCNAIGATENIHLVRDLWHDREWNMETLGYYFPAGVVKEICKIPIPFFEDKDRWTWHFSNDGKFSVRSAYHMLIQNNACDKASSSSVQLGFDWNLVWNSNIPQKIKVFVWRALKSGIAAKSLLKLRGLCDDATCPMCGDKEESVLHLLVTCTEVRKIWYYSPLRLTVADVICPSLFDWVLALKTTFKEKRWWDLFWSLIWGIWLRRNSWVFEKKKKRDVDVIHKAVGIVGEFDAATAVHANHQPSLKMNSVWQPPFEGILKINSDAATSPISVGLGGVSRDYVGDVLVSTCMQVPGTFSVDVAEAMALRHALKINLEAGFSKFIIEVDNLKLYSHLAKGISEPTFFGGVIADIRHLTKMCQQLSFSFIRRSGNSVAHALAKLSFKYDDFRVWLECIPNALEALVSADIAAFVAV